jgi:hypothetical protein
MGVGAGTVTGCYVSGELDAVNTAKLIEISIVKEQQERT